ncbi:heparanase-like protein 2 [Gossypium hirsutum]|uniref:Heparanase-like protein 2 n=1 Tax=Gossypium hirsutum TaxID=3635 RepID=A0ABM2YTC8_GOSHI|nr:heparanase-like protein 2 [Gossypium hirsutum]XP_040933762.1 heparanase-like protein 2 [Gossypium hirsutum]
MDLKCIFSLAILVSQISLSSMQNVNVVIQGATSSGFEKEGSDKCNKRIKVGGSLQDQVVYGVGGVKNCPNFMKNEDSLFGFSQGCLPLERWDELNKFFNQTRNMVTFGLNALFGRNRSQIEKGLWVGDWKLQNARDFMKYTISKGYKVDSYEFGNQLSGAGMGASVEAKQYGKDIVVLKNLVKELHPYPKTQPKVLGSSGYYDEKWFNSFLEVSGHDVVDGVTHHIYNLGPGIQICLNSVFIEEFLEAYLLLVGSVTETYKGVLNIVNKFKPQSGAWVSESGGALHGGAKDLSPTFADGFWYLDQFGMASTYNRKVFCRQTLIGGNYALLSTTTSIPNPDYYGALLWHRLMGSTVLAVTQESNPNLRVYAHCAKKKSCNLRSTDVAKPEFRGSKDREEYHLAALAGNIQGQIVLLNDVPMVPTEIFDISAMEPKLVNASTPISIAAHSIVYVTIRDFQAPACA